uniref:Uncharacterized protein n=1 Tax=Phlebia radiata TaxID=5308 RepID=L8B9F4_PHLRA|nr:hypothetical protein PRA_mt0140 [Phlebia radiata]CCE89224.1 hypothetical protein PRA_mt0140 [Phlebia radiata]
MLSLRYLRPVRYWLKKMFRQIFASRFLASTKTLCSYSVIAALNKKTKCLNIFEVIKRA